MKRYEQNAIPNIYISNGYDVVKCTYIDGLLDYDQVINCGPNNGMVQIRDYNRFVSQKATNDYLRSIFLAYETI